MFYETEERSKRIGDLAAAGWHAHAIADKEKVSIATVYRHAKIQGVQIAHCTCSGPGRRGGISALRIIGMLQKGQKQADIARKLKIHRQYVHEVRTKAMLAGIRGI